MNTSAVIYEVRLRLDADIESDFDAWLRSHVSEMLRHQGFETAETLYPESPDASHKLRIVRYRVSDRAQLDHYVAHHAEAMRASGTKRFGGRFTASRVIYSAQTETTSAAQHACQNCEAPLRGQYCAACGQRHEHRIISLFSLARELVGDLFDLDSRIWRTVWPLLFAPGRLTAAYLRGQRVRYTPPLRLYLVSSLLFFVVAFFGSGDFLDNFDLSDIVLEIDEEADNTASDTLRDNAPGSALVAGAGAEPDLPPVLPPAPTAADESTTVAAPGSAAEQTSTDAEKIKKASESMAENCDKISLGEDKWAVALTTRAVTACHRLTAEGGYRRFAASLIDNLPGMMVIFLPVVALAMSLLYPFSRRYYVEHLLFFVHYHSFFFIALTVVVLVSRVPDVLPGQGIYAGIFTAATVIYVPAYLFIAMRRIYNQHFLVTLLKYLALGLAYFFSLLLTLVMVLLFTALSV